MAGTSRGLFLLDGELRAVGYCDGAVEDCKGLALPDGSQLIAVVHSDDTLAGYTVGALTGPR